MVRTILVMRRCPVCRYRIVIDKYDAHVKAHNLLAESKAALLRKDET